MQTCLGKHMSKPLCVNEHRQLHLLVEKFKEQPSNAEEQSDWEASQNYYRS